VPAIEGTGHDQRAALPVCCTPERDTSLEVLVETKGRCSSIAAAAAGPMFLMASSPSRIPFSTTV
jgi:hypothetical protein